MALEMANTSTASPFLARSIPDTLASLLHSPPHLSLLQEWRSDDRSLRSRWFRKTQNLSSARSETYHLLGFFSVFQTVIFTALAQSNILACKDWPIPFGLSLTVCMGTLLALHQKFEMIALIEEELQRTRGHADALYDGMKELIRLGDRYNLRRLGCEPSYCPQQAMKHPNLFSWKCILTYGFAVRAIVVVLSGIILIACPMILCAGCACKG